MRTHEVAEVKSAPFILDSNLISVAYASNIEQNIQNFSNIAG